MFIHSSSNSNQYMMMNIVLIILFIKSINSQLNFYLDSISVQQLFGIWFSIIFLSNIFLCLEINDYQLYFINQNQIRYSALESSLYIPANIHFVQLTWNEDRVSSIQIYFNLNSFLRLSYIMNIIQVQVMNKFYYVQY